IGADIIPRGQKLTVELCHSRAPPPGAGCRSVRAHDSISGSGNGATGPAWATGPTREVTCSNCLRCATGPAGHTGPTGPTGPTGEVKVQTPGGVRRQGEARLSLRVPRRTLRSPPAGPDPAPQNVQIA